MNFNFKDLKINYEVIGEGKPVLMIHGFCPDHRFISGCMEHVFTKIKGYKRIYIDLPGMGKSNFSSCIKNADDLLEILISFINHVIPNEHFLLCGQSYGGYLSRGILYKMIERVDGLFLLCPVIIPDSSKRNVPNHELIYKDESYLSELPEEKAVDFCSSIVSATKYTYDRYENEVVSGLKLVDMTNLMNYKKNGYEFSFDVDKLLKCYAKPALIICGKQDSCVGYLDAVKILDKFPRASFSVLDIAGHNLQIEQPELFNALVSNWLKRAA